MVVVSSATPSTDDARGSVTMRTCVAAVSALRVSAPRDGGQSMRAMS